MSDIQLTWMGHGTFSARTWDGADILLDCWVGGNPACPDDLKRKVKPDAMFLTHGHFDHIADAVDLAKKHAPEIVGIFELCHWLESKGVKKTHAMNKGGTQEVLGIKATMVHADHSCGISEGDAIVYGGEAAGYVLEFRNGFKLYFAGDTNVFGDMKLIGDLYKPDAACLPIGDLFTMGPREAAFACRMLGVRTVVPMHWGTFPALTGTPDALRALVADVKGLRIASVEPGQTIKLGK